MIRKQMIAMLLAGGQGSRLGVLTEKMAKPAVAFGGKYRIIDFPLSNCVNSGIDTVGVLTQYQPHRLNTHIGIGIPWDLDKNEGGVTVLPPFEKNTSSEWYTGTANAIYQNLDYMEQYQPDYVLILSGDHIYKMDYQMMLDYHRANEADVTIACMQVSPEEAHRFGIMVTDASGRVLEFQEKPDQPFGTLASMGIYIFNWSVLKQALIDSRSKNGCDFGKHVLPYCKENGMRLFAWQFQGYWRDVGTLGAYWEAHMELTDRSSRLNLYEEKNRIYTREDNSAPQFVADTAVVEQSVIGDGSEIFGEITRSVIGSDVTVERGAVVRDSIVMDHSVIHEGAILEKAILAERTSVGRHSRIGCGEELPNEEKPSVYAFGLSVIGEGSVIPDGVRIGKNTAVSGVTFREDYPCGCLKGGRSLIKEGGCA